MKKKIKIASIHSSPILSIRQENGMDLRDKARRLKEKNLEKTYEFLREAGRQDADLAVTHESMDALIFGNNPEDREWNLSLAEEIPGPISEVVSGIAVQYGMNIAANYHEKEKDRIYNTSVLIDRRGKIIGKYRKIHMAASEKWHVDEGDAFTVLQSDIGGIGFAICYDIIFQEHCRALALNGADIIIHQTMGWGTMGSQEMGEALVRTRAADNCACLVVSKNIQKVNSKYGKSCIIDNRGYILAEAGGEQEKVVMAEFEPDFDCMQEDHFNALFSGVDSLRACLLLERKPSLYSVLTEKNPPIRMKYKDMRLKTEPDEVGEILRKLEEYRENIRNNRPVEKHYHW